MITVDDLVSILEDDPVLTNKPEALIVMRLIDMHKLHPHQDNSRRCSKCGWGVGIYPSGQKVLRENPSLPVICNVCRDWKDAVISMPAAKSMEELLKESQDSVDVPEA